MNWYKRRWWRFAWTFNADRRKSLVRDNKGRWRRVWHGLYIRQGKRWIRRKLAKWALSSCPHEAMKADVLEGQTDYAVAWCPDCGKIRIVNRDPSYSGVQERTPMANDEHSMYDVIE